MNSQCKCNKLRISSGYDSATGKYSVILYEYPFNERIRTYLRLEHLFLRLAELMARLEPLITTLP